MIYVTFDVHSQAIQFKLLTKPMKLFEAELPIPIIGRTLIVRDRYLRSKIVMEKLIVTHKHLILKCLSKANES